MNKSISDYLERLESEFNLSKDAFYLELLCYYNIKNENSMVF